MILADTSVWIRFVKRQAPYVERLDGLLDAEEVVGHRHVHGELLMGDTGGRGRLLGDFEALPWAGTIADAEVAEFVRRRRLAGRGIGWIDAHLLASCLVCGHRLWSADAALIQLAQELNVNYAAAMLER